MKNLLSAMTIGVLLAAGAMGTAHAQRTPVLMVQFEDQTWHAPAGKAQSEAEVREGIVKAVRSHSAERHYPWQVDSDAAGKIGASVTVRRSHIARVAISYTSNTFSVTYAGSEKLNVGEMNCTGRMPNSPCQTVPLKGNTSNSTGNRGTMVIHPYYNAWVGDLVKAIRDQLSRG